MQNRIDTILQQYGLDAGTPSAEAPAAGINPTAPPVPGAPPADPAIGQDPMGNLRQAVSYAQQLGEQAKSSIHAGAKVAQNAPGIAGAAATGIAQATAPGGPPPPVDAPTVANLIRQHESGNDYTALNKQGSTASGAYQYTDPTWAGYGGYSRAAFAPRAVQDQRAQADVAARLQQYEGDPFKAIAAHYLPAAASDPSTWAQPYKLPNGHTVSPVADYVRATVANTPLQGQFDAYLRHYTG